MVNTEEVIRGWSILSLGFIASFFIPIIPLLIGYLLFTLVDIYSSVKLSYRVKQRLKRKGITDIPENSGKFQTSKASKVVEDLIDGALVVILFHFLDVVILHNLNILYLANYATAVICILQVFSVLENISSSNSKPWAKALQKLLADKTSRHISQDLYNLLKDIKDEDNKEL